MKVLIISSDKSFFEKNSGGDVWDRHLAYAKNLEKLFIVVKTSAAQKFKEVIRGNVAARPSGGSCSFSILKNIFKLSSEAIRKEKIDLINAQDPMIYGLIGYLLKKKHKIPLVVNWHGDFWDNREWLRERKINFLLLKLSKFLAKKADKIRVVNPLIKDKLIKMGVGGQKIKVISTPVDLEKFSENDAKIFNSLAERYGNKKIILFVGRLEKEKNLIFFIKVFKKVLTEIPAAYFLMIGEGSLRQEITALIKKEGLADNVELLGKVGHQELSNYYRLANLLILPSKHESFGKVILEAAMQKTPTLAARTTGAVFIISSQELFFNVEDQDECLKKLVVLLANDELRIRLGNDLYEQIKNKYSWSKSVEDIAKMWHETASNKT